MEGVAIGSQPVAAWAIFLAVIAHKGLASFALGLELQKSRHVSPIKLFYSICLFALMTPVGIFIGWISTAEEEGQESVSSGICTALSAGTFLFVAVMEIIPQELDSSENACLKTFALLSGFGIFGALA